MTGIYKFTNKVNGKIYIGQSIDVIKRYKRHIYQAFNNTKSNKDYKLPFHAAMRKYGKENFTFEILEECPREQLNEREQYWISFYDSFKNGYNATIGGDQLPHKEGESHPLHKLTEQQVYYIREQYKNHRIKDDVWEEFKGRIGPSGFHKIWNGDTWKNVHMDVYTPENVSFHTTVRNSHPGKGNGKRLTINQIKDIRKRILTEPRDKIYEDYKDFVGSKQIFTKVCNYETYPWITI